MTNSNNNQEQQEQEQTSTNDYVNEINELKKEVQTLKEQLGNLKIDNTTLFNTINTNLDKIVKNTEKEQPAEPPKPRRF